MRRAAPRARGRVGSGAGGALTPQLAHSRAPSDAKRPAHADGAPRAAPTAARGADAGWILPRRPAGRKGSGTKLRTPTGPPRRQPARGRRWSPGHALHRVGSMFPARSEAPRAMRAAVSTGRQPHPTPRPRCAAQAPPRTGLTGSSAIIGVSSLGGQKWRARSQACRAAGCARARGVGASPPRGRALPREVAPQPPRGCTAPHTHTPHAAQPRGTTTS